MKEQVDHARLRAIVQGIIDKEKGVEVFEDYMKTAFPWIETAKNREKMDHIKKLMSEVKRGPIAINRMDGGGRNLRSRMRTKVEVRGEPVKRDVNQLYDKLGRFTPRQGS